MNAEQMIALLQQADHHRGNTDVAVASAALMGQLSAQLVGEPLDDGEITETEWVLLQHSLRKFSASPRSTAAWNAMCRQAAALEAALHSAEAAASAAPQAAESQTAKRPLGKLWPAWLSGLRRERSAPDKVAAPPASDHAAPRSVVHGNNTTVIQQFGDITNSQNVEITGLVKHSAPTTDDAGEGDVKPYQPGLAVGEPFIFLSYSRRNAARMRRIRADLTAAGFNVWTDESLQPGTPSWLNAIDNAIRSAMCVMVLLTPDARKSEWVDKELATAKIHRKEIIPLLAQGSEQTALPLLLSSTQYVDIRSEKEYKKAMRKIVTVLGNLQRGVVAYA